MTYLRLRKSFSGFTLVELLVVIVVIAILATISVVSYRGIQHRAADSARTTESRQIETAIRTHEANTGSVLPLEDSTDPAVTIAEYELSSMTNLRYASYAGGSQHPDNFSDKSLVYMRNYSNAIGWTYWSYKDSSWINMSINDQGAKDRDVSDLHAWTWIGSS